jgi:hypothetical protein
MYFTGYKYKGMDIKKLRVLSPSLPPVGWKNQSFTQSQTLESFEFLFSPYLINLLLFFANQSRTLSAFFLFIYVISSQISIISLSHFLARRKRHEGEF